MTEYQNEPIIKEKLRIPTWVTSITSVFLIVVISSSAYYYITHKQFFTPTVTSFVLSDELRVRFDALTKEDNLHNYLTEQLLKITLPEPVDTNVSDVGAYLVAKSALTPKLRNEVASDTLDNAFAINGVPFEKYLDQYIEREKYHQLFIDMHVLINKLNQTFKRPSLQNRISGVEVIGNQGDNSVYPNMRVADGYLAAAIVGMLDPNNEKNTLLIADNFARRGMMYGWYGQSDSDATKMMMTEYLAKLNLKEFITGQIDSGKSK